jgi:hypothetical protein
MLPLNFGTPAPEELPVLDFLSTPHTCDWFRWQVCGVTGDCGLRYGKACCLSDALLDYFPRLLYVKRAFLHENFIVLLSCHYFLLYCTSHSYLDGMLSVSIILQRLKPIRMAENVVIRELLDNPFFVLLSHDKLEQWIKVDLLHHYPILKLRQNDILDILASLIMKILTG